MVAIAANDADHDIQNGDHRKSQHLESVGHELRTSISEVQADA